MTMTFSGATCVDEHSLTKNQMLKASDCCISILRRYRTSDRTAAARDLMVAEVQTVVGWLLELDLPPNRTLGGILVPVERYLLTHYGSEAGRCLNAEFVEAFEKFGMGLLLSSAANTFSHDGQHKPAHDGQKAFSHDGHYDHERDGRGDGG